MKYKGYSDFSDFQLSKMGLYFFLGLSRLFSGLIFTITVYYIIGSFNNFSAYLKYRKMMYTREFDS